MSKVNFRHYRLYINGQLMPYGGMTIAYEIDDTNPNGFRYGVATCSPLDNYCKETGRQLAMSRMDKNAFSISEVLGVVRSKLINSINDKWTVGLYKRGVVKPGAQTIARIARKYDKRQPLLLVDLFFGATYDWH